jgi:hypothetical protein
MKPDGQAPKTTATRIAVRGGEAKRRAARRRFLARGTAVGSGLLIVTLYHQRGIAGGSKKIFTSSAEMCLSLKGTPGKTEPIPNPENPKEKIPAVQCSNVPDYKIPWMKK